MIDLSKIQEDVFQNKVDKGFNTTDVYLELAYIQRELGEFFTAHHVGGDMGDELADVAIYLLGLAQIVGIDLETEIKKKVEINKKRIYEKQGNGFVKKSMSEDVAETVVAFLMTSGDYDEQDELCSVLDELVDESMSYQGSVINNSGPVGQIQFLINDGWKTNDILGHFGFKESDMKKVREDNA